MIYNRGVNPIGISLPNLALGDIRGNGTYSTKQAFFPE